MVKKSLLTICFIPLIILSLITSIFAFDISNLFSNSSSEEITDSEFSDAVNVLSSAGILLDVSNNGDDSNQFLSRAMMVTFLGRLSGQPAVFNYTAKVDLHIHLTQNPDSLIIGTIVTGEKFNLISMLGSWYKVEYGDICGYVSKEEISSSINIYSDVEPFAYYMPYISWALENDYITLTDSLTFSPDGYITREAFCYYLDLYLKNNNLSGDNDEQNSTSLETSINDKDSIDSVYYSSVISAISNNFIRLDSNGNFNPQKNITRRQAIFFLATLYNKYYGSQKNDTTATDPTKLDPSSYTDGTKFENVSAPTSNIRVGLYYGDHMLSSAYFANSVGSGFRVGFYNDEGFISLLETNLTSIAIIPEHQLSLSEDTIYYPYHLITANNYSSYSDAAKASANYSNSFVGYINGYYKVLFGFYGSLESASSSLNKLKYADASSKKITLNDASIEKYNIGIDVYSPGSNSFVVLDSSSSYPILVINSTSITTLVIEPSLDNEYTETWLNDYKYCGTFELTRYDSYISAINNVDIENYVKGVLPYEMESGWPAEALKAQAVCIRSYVMAHLNDYSEWGFDVNDNVECQVYRGTTNAQKDTDDAVDATAGQYLRYEGNICNAMYSSSDGGSTESFGNLFSSDIPYLIGVEDPFEASSSIDYYNKTWSFSRSGEDLQENISSLGFNIGSITSVSLSHSGTNNVIRVDLSDSTGNIVSLSKDKIRSVLDLPSCHFDCTQNDSTFEFSGGGWGHNVGMSQWGAYIMAKEYGYTYKDILCFYFQGAYVM